MAIYHQSNFHGIILYSKSYRDNDLLIKFLTAEAGKKMFLVRGAKKKNFKMKAELLPFTYGKYIGSLNNHGLSYIKDFIDTHNYQNISNDIVLNAYATYIMGLIDAAFLDNQIITSWFKKLYQGLTLINHQLDPAIITNIFEIQLLSVFGVAPKLNGCIICGRNTSFMDYSENYGGLLCSNHWYLDRYRFHLDRKTIYYLRLFSSIDLNKINNINVNVHTKHQLRFLLDNIYSNSVGLNLKSKSFLDQLNDFKL